MNCRFILSRDTHGMRNDIASYATWFPKHTIHIIGQTDVTAADINFYIERPRLECIDQATVNVLSCNYEFLMHKSTIDETLKALPKIDFVVCKTRTTQQYCENLKREHRYKYKTVYTRHITQCGQPSEPDDRVAWLHVAGTSPYKNTDIVIQAWQRHPEWPPLYYVCEGVCRTNLDRYLPDSRAANIHNLGPQDDISAVQNRIYNHVCPSMVEGYGHYINEARAYSRYIVTSDHGPMNELVTANSGHLIPCSSTPPKRASAGVCSCLFTVEDFERGMIQAMSVPDARRRKLAARAHADYIRDCKFFATAMGKFISTLSGMIKKYIGVRGGTAREIMAAVGRYRCNRIRTQMDLQLNLPVHVEVGTIDPAHAHVIISPDIYIK